MDKAYSFVRKRGNQIHRAHLSRHQAEHANAFLPTTERWVLIGRKPRVKPKPKPQPETEPQESPSL